MQTTLSLTIFAAALLAAPADAFAAPRAARGVSVSRSAVSRSVAPRASFDMALTITEDEVIKAQRIWADGVVGIGKAFTEGGNYVAMATAAASDIYAYDYGKVLFKPTRCAEVQFRPEPKDALSYFVGGDIAEDGGFAIQPWSDVKFVNHGINCHGDTAIAMGNYWFTDANTGAKSKVEYTFGYRKFEKGKIRIFLHHSSVPYQPPGAADGPNTALPPAVTESNATKVLTLHAGGKRYFLHLHKNETKPNFLQLGAAAAVGAVSAAALQAALPAIMSATSTVSS